MPGLGALQKWKTKRKAKGANPGPDAGKSSTNPEPLDTLEGPPTVRAGHAAVAMAASSDVPAHAAISVTTIATAATAVPTNGSEGGSPQPTSVPIEPIRDEISRPDTPVATAPPHNRGFTAAQPLSAVSPQTGGANAPALSPLLTPPTPFSNQVRFHDAFGLPRPPPPPPQRAAGQGGAGAGIGAGADMGANADTDVDADAVVLDKDIEGARQGSQRDSWTKTASFSGPKAPLDTPTITSAADGAEGGAASHLVGSGVEGGAPVTGAANASAGVKVSH